jgi:hypothetical protein
MASLSWTNGSFYVFYDEEQNLVKIGSVKNLASRSQRTPRDRLRKLSQQPIRLEGKLAVRRSLPLKMIAFKRFNSVHDGPDWEITFRDKFNQYWIQGLDWFAPSREIVDFIKDPKELGAWDWIVPKVLESIGVED